MILLDTNAVLWLSTGHRRARPLARFAGRLCISPANILELQFLCELGRMRFARGKDASSVADDPRWVLDDPPAAAWFQEALSLGWTHDPFDRLIVAHARQRRFRLATGDATLLDKLRPAELVEL